MLLQLSQVLNGLDKQRQKDFTFDIQECPCYKILYTVLPSHDFICRFPDDNLVEILLKDNV